MAAPSLTHVPTLHPECVLDALRPEAVSFQRPGGVRLTLDRNLVPSLIEQVNHGVEAAPRGGIEIGGLLVAPSLPAAQNLVVPEAIPITLEYRFGPSFRPSELDLTVLTDAVARVRRDPSRMVVGLYRSRIRGDAALRDTDRELIRAVAHGHAAFESEFQGILVLSQISGMKIAATMLWANKTTTLAAPTEPIGPAVAPPLPSPAPPSEPVAAAAAAPPLHLPTVLPEPARPLYRGIRGRRRAAIVLSLGAVGVIAAGAYAGFYTALWQAGMLGRPVVVSPLDLGLAATPRPDHGWKLTWNGAAISALSPVSAILTIRDGLDQQNLILSPGDLAAGNIVYRSRGGDLLFQLSVHYSGRPALEQRVRVLDGQQTAEPTPTPQPQPTRKPQTAEAPPSVTTFQPVIRPALNLPEAVSNPPKPIREVDASAPPQAPAVDPLEVKVRIQIGADGKVTEAVPMGLTGDNAPWMDRASAAAKRWLFEPARENGRPVPGEAVLTFLFRP